MQTVKDYCDYLGWSVTELARRAGTDYKTARKAYDQESISLQSKGAIARAFADALDQRINVGDITW